MIEAIDIHFLYPNKVEALKGVSLTIKDGEFIAIMGQNGAGKSTFVKHFNGLLKPHVGTVRVNGVETTKTSVASLSQKRRLRLPKPRPPTFQRNSRRRNCLCPQKLRFRARSD